MSRNSEREDARLRDASEPKADSPVFAASWEAEAFALAVTLSSQGLYSWNEWTETLGDELVQAAGDSETPDGPGYYLHWLAALERIAVAKGIVD